MGAASVAIAGTRAKTAVQVAQAEEDMLRTHLEYAVIHAPFTGVVTERLAEPGDILPRHSHLLILIDADSLKAPRCCSPLP